MKRFSTTTYAPAEGCHDFRPAEPDARICTTCWQYSWDGDHAQAETFVFEAVEARAGLFVVECSDDRGRSYAVNGLRWPDRESAERWAGALAMRWFGATDIRVRATDEAGDPTGPVLSVQCGDERTWAA